MRVLFIIGVLLLVFGVLALGYQGFSYITQDRIIDAGPLQVTAQREHFVWVPPVVGGAALAAGIVLCLFGGRKTT